MNLTQEEINDKVTALLKRKNAREKDIEALEAEGIEFDPNGPTVGHCEYCDKPFQYVADHKCYGTACAAGECRFNEYDDRD